MPRSRASRKGKKVTPAMVKAATKALLADPNSRGRIERVQRSARASATRLPATTSAYISARSGTSYDVKDLIAPSHFPGAFYSGSSGLRDIKGLEFNAYLADIYIGNGTLGTNDTIYFRWVDGGGTARVQNLYPMAPGNWGASGGFGVTYINDMFKHFRRKTYRRLVAVYEPRGGGASTATGQDITFAPMAGGEENFLSATFSSTTTLTGFSIGAIRSMKGGVTTPLWQRWICDMMPYARNPAGTKTFSIESEASNANALADGLNAQAIPCSLAIAGTNALGTTARGTVIGQLVVHGVVDLEDFTGGLLRGDVALPRSDEKALPPRSVLANRGQQPLPPDDRGWVITEYDALRQPTLRRSEPERSAQVKEPVAPNVLGRA